MGHLAPMVRGFHAAAAFLTRVPLPNSDARPEEGVTWFPVVGALIGLVIAVVYASASAVLEPFIAAALAIAAGALITGGFHEDGLADTADAFGGGWNRDDVLRILKDPRQGTFGVLALVISSLLKVGAIASLDAWGAIAVLPAAHALSRSAAIGLFPFVAPATGEGLGAAYASGITRVRVAQTLLAGIAIALSLLGVLFLPSVAISLVLLLVVARMAERKAGGLTGDVLGAAQQVVEIVVLLVASSFATNGWAMLPWWRS